MRFLMMLKADENTEAGAPPPPELFAAIGKLTEEMTRAGVVLAAEGLHPTSRGARVRISASGLTVTDGPFTESKELIASFAMIRAASKEEALEHAARFLRVHRDVLGPSYTGELEVRQVFDAADFAPAGASR